MAPARRTSASASGVASAARSAPRRLCGSAASSLTTRTGYVAALLLRRRDDHETADQGGGRQGVHPSAHGFRSFTGGGGAATGIGAPGRPVNAGDRSTEPRPQPRARIRAAVPGALPSGRGAGGGRTPPAGARGDGRRGARGAVRLHVHGHRTPLTVGLGHRVPPRARSRRRRPWSLAPRPGRSRGRGPAPAAGGDALVAMSVVDELLGVRGARRP